MATSLRASEANHPKSAAITVPTRHDPSTWRAAEADFCQRWRAVTLIGDTHPIGERKQPAKTALALAGEEAMVVQTMGGRMHVRWDEIAARRRTGNWCSCGVTGHSRRIRSLGGAMPAELYEPECEQQTRCAEHASGGREVGYNPHKPGRPSHGLHTFWIGNLRLVLDAVLNSGKQHTSGHAKAPLKRLLDELGEHKPALVRGDCGYGNQDIIDICEERACRTCCGCARRPTSSG